MFVVVLLDLGILELRVEQEVQLSTITDRYLNVSCILYVSLVGSVGNNDS